MENALNTFIFLRIITLVTSTHDLARFIQNKNKFGRKWTLTPQVSFNASWWSFVSQSSMDTRLTVLYNTS